MNQPNKSPPTLEDYLLILVFIAAILLMFFGVI